jgi:hypothetical protein
MTMENLLSPAADMPPHWLWAAMCPATDIGWLDLVGTPVEMRKACRLLRAPAAPACSTPVVRVSKTIHGPLKLLRWNENGAMSFSWNSAPF